MIAIPFVRSKISAQQLFMLSALVVNGGNYLYNLLLGRLLGPEAFADAAILVTLLLVLSFAAMTFQLGTARFIALLSEEKQPVFLNRIQKWSLRFGLVLGCIFIVFSSFLQELFQTSSQAMFVVFGISVPLYFVMSINRGLYQGKEQLINMAKTYQIEMWSRLVLTLLCILLFKTQPAIGVALGVSLSLIAAQFPRAKDKAKNSRVGVLTQTALREILQFFVITACYEGTQILINNSDILLVKHYFDSYQAGLYASLALIGRVVYFVAWMFVMLLLPEVVRKHKAGESTQTILFKYVSYISILALSIVAACFLFSNLIVQMMFGEAYVSVSHLLGPYALATGLFAVANLFTYYFLSLGKYTPVYLSFIGGFLQIGGIILMHNSLEQVVWVQIGSMSLLLIIQVLYYLKAYKVHKTT
ncbi:oligosaccharide flippase family protein [Leeuwenhoekiella sp. ZYFB001]|uniref:oligosaccharide flippase family protein n=1 Tax=Leeuwenhoekiella sp. ZYFB001 TaxID=2719912 RepID=UPI00142FF1C4|nr:oligosaccharide flippase family protein [Leeuwenhoekiella sp. ZYFB001]